jgi:murein DD-endopeptidase MepM/ murein hydrolase activator NlpD
MRRLRSPRALFALAVPVLFGWTATSLHPTSVDSTRAVMASATAGWTLDRAAFLGGPAGRADRSTRPATAAPAAPVPPPAPTKVRPARGAVTGVFGEWRSNRRHPGLDIDGATHDPIVAAYEGTVEVAGWAPAGFGGYGIMVLVDHGMGLKTLYAHLAGAVVRPGDHVAAGQLIGSLGNTGASRGSHLHFEVFVGGARVDPAVWLAEP